MPLISTRGAASAQGFGEFAQSAAPVYIEDVFSTYLYTGNGSTQTITNGIDLSGKGGLVWMKGRSGATNHALYDTVRGATKDLVSNSTAAETTQATGLTAFSGTGFSIGALAKLNTNAATYASWTFRKQAKFFDVVTYTGNGINDRQLNHSLESIPRWIIVKRLDASEDWLGIFVTSDNGTSSTNAFVGSINLSDALFNVGGGSVTATTFKPWVARNSSNTINGNVSGATYVAYLFAHDAGGFGLSGTDNVISCGSYTGTGAAGNAITTGYEPQYLLIKNTSSAASWFIYDVMRGLSVGGPSVAIIANTSDAEGGTATNVKPTATGFVVDSTSGGLNASGNTYIYIAIRRGPMKVPTSGTSVYQPLTGQPNGSGLFAHNILTDFSFYHFAAGTQNWGVQDRLRGSPDLSFNTTAAENGLVGGNKWDTMTGYINPNPGSGAYDSWAFRRAPSFFDVVCYTGTGSANSVTHNLGVAPELMIVKPRSTTGFWRVYSATLGNTQGLSLNGTDAAYSAGTSWNSATPTSTAFSVNATATNSSGVTYVAYLFATVAGVSKVGSYTGSGTTKQIDCGFSSGARFVLIKRTDSTGDWYVYDSARGIVAGNDPYALLNSGAANVTSTDYVDTYSAGFELSSTAPAALNANGGSFIFFAVA